MGYANILDTLEKPGGIPKKGTAKLMQAGLSVIELAINRSLRARHGIDMRSTVSSNDGKYLFPSVLWHRESSGYLLNFALVDKRKIGAGLYFTVDTEVGRGDHTAVHALVINDQTFPYRGLKRVFNDVLAGDVAPVLIETMHASTILEPVNSKPSQIHLDDYAKIIATVL